ncbi:MAG: YidB family protein [Isosphaeraceae bacterium]
MSWLDALKKQVLDSIGSALPGGGATDPAPSPDTPPPDAGGLFDGAVALIREKGLGSLMAAFDQHGLRETFVPSWISKGANPSISADQLRQVLGPETIEALARRFGISTAQASSLMAHMLPQLVDQMTPNGQIEDAPPEAAAPESGHF